MTFATSSVDLLEKYRILDRPVRIEESPLKHQTKEIQTAAEPASTTRNHIQFIE